MNTELKTWFCVRSQPKHEHIAAAHLLQLGGIEVYLPRIRYRRPTRGGPMWFTEPLFPGYLFAGFDPAACLRKVHHARGVQGVVHFGAHWPAIPEHVIQELRAEMSSDQVHVIPETLTAGDTVVVSGGILDSLRGVVARVMPARQRVAILMDFLGRQTPVEMPSQAVVREKQDVGAASW